MDLLFVLSAENVAERLCRFGIPVAAGFQVFHRLGGSALMTARTPCGPHLAYAVRFRLYSSSTAAVARRRATRAPTTRWLGSRFIRFPSVRRPVPLVGCLRPRRPLARLI